MPRLDSELTGVLQRLRRRADASRCFPSLSPRVTAAAGGILAGLARRGVRHARLRSGASGGRVVLGVNDCVEVGADVALSCIQSLREAASVAALAPHVAGSFTVAGQAVRIESYRCHDGLRAFVHVAGDEPRPLAPPLTCLADLGLLALQDLHGSAIAPEDLLAAHVAACASDPQGLVTRHADFTLLAATARRRLASRLTAALQDVLCHLVSRGDWRLAWEPVAECSAWLRHRGTDGSPVRRALQACREAATPEALAGLSPVLAGR